MHPRRLALSFAAASQSVVMVGEEIEPVKSGLVLLAVQGLVLVVFGLVWVVARPRSGLVG